MRVHKLLPFLACLGASLLAAGPVAAQPANQPSTPVLTLSPATLVGCGHVILEGAGYAADETIEVTVATASPVVREASATERQAAHASSDGAFSLMIGLSEIGRVTVTATGTRSGASAAGVVTVVPPACSGMSAPGNSGAQLFPVGAAAATSVLLAGLAGTVLIRRRRAGQ